MSRHGRHRWLSEGAETLVAALGATTAQDDVFDCDVLIVGSGYGGAVAAARLAGSRHEEGDRPARIWLLERGQEYLPGAFPSTFAELAGHVRFSQQDGRPPRGRPEGLFDVRLGGHVNVLLGNGLGGGSLINAAVMERPTADAFAVQRSDGTGPPRRAWPAAIDLDSLEPHFRQAEAMLDAEPIPGTVPKLDSLFAAARSMGAFEHRKAKAAVAFSAKRTPAGVAMQACLNCGDCVSGCNHRAKQSLDVNYLALAEANGARLFCGATVHRLLTMQPHGEGHAVEFFFTDPNKAPSDRARPYVVRARRVILAAGTLGSTEILLRSQQAGLPVAADALGANFSGNGDLIAAAYRQKDEASCSAREGDAPADRHVGPTITGLVRHRAADLARPLALEEFAIPGPLRRVLGEVLAAADAAHGATRIDWRCHAPDDAVDDPQAVSDDAIDHTPIYGMMGDDGASGRIELVVSDEATEAGKAVGSDASTTDPSASKGPTRNAAAGHAAVTDARTRIVWPDAGRMPVFDAQIEALRAAHERFGGRGGQVLPNPLWQPLPRIRGIEALSIRGPTTTVHPLGGCSMADSHRHGVVDSHGRVWASHGDVLPGLAVLDGSIVPVSLGINPSLTIAALAERAIGVLAAEWRLALRSTDRQQGAERPMLRDVSRPKAPAPTRVKLEERMTGRVVIDGKPFDMSAVIGFATIDAASLRRLPGIVAQPDVALSFMPADAAAPTGRSPSATAAGTARVLVRERSNVVGRVLRSIGPARRRLAARGGGPVTARGLLEALALCSHLGQVRLLEYDWTVSAADADAPVRAGQRLRLTKRIAFADAANPWRQLTEGHLEAVADDRHGARGNTPLGRLALDPAFFVERSAPLLSIEAQEDQPNALADLAELGLWVLRIVMRIHLLAFLPPTDATRGSASRLPGPLAGVEPERIEVAIAEPVEGRRASAKFLLSRYTPPSAERGKRPVLLIHGYGAGGSTFAHPSIGVNLVQALLAAGRETWVLDLRTSIGLEQRHYWSFDEVATQDIPAAFAEILKRMRRCEGDGDGDGKIDVVAHCIGAAMFSVAVLSSPDLHRQVGAVVLSQVGPLLRMTAFNRFRGYVSSWLRQFIGTDQFDSKPGGDPLKAMLIDAALASFPYPDDDHEAERQRTVPGFTAVRHRADAIFGQTMQLENVGDETLRSLDAIYGWVMVEGLAQTIHYAKERLLTDPNGTNRVVASESLAHRFDFPLLMLHGRINALFDWRGSYDTVRLLTRVFDGDEWPEEPPAGSVFGAGAPRRLRIVERYGHQDTLIGEAAHRDVFPHVVGFLDEFRSSSRQGARGTPVLLVAQPAVGPMLGRVGRDPHSGPLRCRIALQPPASRTSLRAVVHVPARRAGDGLAWRFDLDAAVMAPLAPEVLADGAVEVSLHADAASRYDGFAVLTVHNRLPEAVAAAGVPGHGLFASPTAALPDELTDAVRACLADPANDVDLAVVELDPAWIDAACGMRSATSGQWMQAARPTLRFVLASCRYPPGLVDRRPAQSATERLSNRLRASPPNERAQLLVLAGDQVYVDAGAGLFDPAGTTEIDGAYRTGLGDAALRRVVKSLPTYPLMNSHEVQDRWEPETQLSADHAYALQAYGRFQHSVVDGRREPPFDYEVEAAGFPFFMLDVRSTREQRVLRETAGATLLDQASIHAGGDLDALLRWLKAAPRDRPKFIATSTTVFPFPLAALGDSDAERLGLDDWSGYPRSQFALLDGIRRERIEHVVLLSGGRHMSSVSSLWLDAVGGDPEDAIEVVSVVSSGLYAPWPCTNTRPDEYGLNGPLTLRHAGRQLVGTVVTAAAGNGDGFALVDVAGTQAGGWQLDVRLDLAGGVLACRRQLGESSRQWAVGASPSEGSHPLPAKTKCG